MKLLVSTAQHLLEVKIAESDKRTRAFEIVDVEPWLSGKTFACAGRMPSGAVTAIHHKNTLDAVGGKMQDMYIVQFTIDGGIIDRNKQDNLRHVHDILYAHGKMYITNTAFNEIMVADDQDARSLKLGDGEGDVNHLNNLWADEESVYVMAHNGNLPEDVPGQIIELDPEGGEAKQVISLPHRKCHHFFRIDDVWFYSASDDGRLVMYEPETGRLADLVVGGFPKGFARIDDKTAVFGTSEHTPFVERRVESHAQIGIVDLERFKVTELMDLKVANVGAGQINDTIRIG